MGACHAVNDVTRASARQRRRRIRHSRWLGTVASALVMGAMVAPEAVIAQVVRIPDFPPVDQTGEIRFEHSFRQLRFPKSQHVRKCGLRGRDRNRNRTGR